jgi:hypothetical protein
MTSYAKAWKTYRRQRNRAIYVPLSILAAALVFIAIENVAPYRKAVFWLWAILSASSFVGTIATYYFRYPRCSKQFTSGHWYYRGAPFFVRHCATCGLAKFAASDDQTV